MKTLAAVIVLAGLLCGCYTLPHFDRESYVAARRSLVDEAIDGPFIAGEAPQCRVCFDRWDRGQLIDGIWRRAFARYDVRQVTCVLESGFVGEVSEDQYKVSALVLTEKGYIAIDAWIEAEDSEMVYREMSDAAVEEFMRTLKNLYGVDERDFSSGDTRVETEDACCYLLYIDWDNRRHLRLGFPSAEIDWPMLEYIEVTLSGQ